MTSKNPDRSNIARFDVVNGPLFEIYTLAQNSGTRVSVMGGPMTGVYDFDFALAAMGWVLVQTGWADAVELQHRYKQHEVADEARKVTE